VFLSAGAFACSDVQLKAGDGTVIVGRTMKWGGILKTAPDGTSSISKRECDVQGEQQNCSDLAGKAGLKFQERYGFMPDVPVLERMQNGHQVHPMQGNEISCHLLILSLHPSAKR